jgi:predicted GNAT family acetyltransferase
MAGEAVRVVDDVAGGRYEIFVGDTLAGFSTYRDRPGVRVVVHSEVFAEFEHRGLASDLARATLDDIARRGLRVVPQCPFVARYISTHHDYAHLVTT